jgi:hypothetical protein
MLGAVRGVTPLLFTAHFQEQFGRIDLFRADGGAQPAEAALEGHGRKRPVARIVGSRNLPGRAVPAQESAFLRTGAAVAAFLCDFDETIFHLPLFRSEARHGAARNPYATIMRLKCISQIHSWNKEDLPIDGTSW